MMNFDIEGLLFDNIFIKNFACYAFYNLNLYNYLETKIVL